MSDTLKQVQTLAAKRDILISDHGYDELASDGILIQDVIDGVNDASRLRIIRIITKGYAFWFCSSTATTNQFTSYGEFPKVQQLRLL